MFETKQIYFKPIIIIFNISTIIVHIVSAELEIRHKRRQERETIATIKHQLNVTIS